MGESDTRYWVCYDKQVADNRIEIIVVFRCGSKEMAESFLRNLEIDGKEEYYIKDTGLSLGE